MEFTSAHFRQEPREIIQLEFYLEQTFNQLIRGNYVPHGATSWLGLQWDPGHNGWLGSGDLTSFSFLTLDRCEVNHCAKEHYDRQNGFREHYFQLSNVRLGQVGRQRALKVLTISQLDYWRSMRTFSCGSVGIIMIRERRAGCLSLRFDKIYCGS